MTTTLTGKNSFLLLQKKQVIISEFIDTYGDLSVERFDCETTEPRTIFAALSNLPFLVDKKLVVLDRPSSNKPLLEKIPDWLEQASDGIDTLIIEPNPDKRTAWYKFLQSTDPVEMKELDEMGTRQWAVQYTDSLGAKMDRAAVDELINRVGLNQMQLHQEITKLSFGSKQITKEQVVDLVESLPQDTIFDMLDALSAGNQKKAAELYDSLRVRRVDANEILPMIGWQLSTLSLIKAAGAGNPNNVASKTGLHPFVVRKNSALAGRLSLQKVKQLVATTIEAELSIKRDGAKADQVVANLLVKLGRELA